MMSHVSPDDSLTPGRLVALEPDPRRAAALKGLLRGHRRLSFDVVTSVPDAIEAIARSVPDIVMASAFLPPADGAELIAQLKQMAGARHVPVIDIPPGVGATASAAPAPRLLGVFRRQSREALAGGCDAATLHAQIDECIRDARAERPPIAADDGPRLSLVRFDADEEDRALPDTSLIVRQPRIADLARRHFETDRSGPERRRALRRRRDEMPWLWSVKLPWGSQVRVVDMSSTGALIETAAKLTAGASVDLKMIGEQANLLVPARTVRSEIAAHDVMGVVYRVALEFAMELEMFGTHPLSPTAALRPHTLADLLTRVMAEVERTTSPSDVWTKFEQELRRLVPAREIQLRPSPADTRLAGESVYFTVPRPSGPGMVLQVTFENGYQPSVVEFRFLQAAAAAAAAVAEFAPIVEESAAEYPHVRALLA